MVDGYNNWLRKTFEIPNQERKIQQLENEKREETIETFKTLWSSAIYPILLGIGVAVLSTICLVNSCKAESNKYGQEINKEYFCEKPQIRNLYTKGLENISFD